MKAIRKMEIAWQKVQGGIFSLSSRTYELREQTTLAQMLTNKLQFIKQLMTDPPRPLGTPPSVANGDSLPFVGPQPHSVATLRPQSPVMEGELARRRRQLMAIHPDADVPLQREKQHTMHRSAMQQAAKPFTPWCVKKEHILAKCHNN